MSLSSETLSEVLVCGDSIVHLAERASESVHLILSDIPYGIGVESWDVLHTNTNSAYLGSSPAQVRAGSVFKKRGKPLNGWSEADRQIPRQYYEWCMRWVPEWFRVLKPGASALVFAGRRLAHRCICAFEDSGFTYKDMLAWDKEKAPYRAQRVSIVFDRRGDLESSVAWQGWRIGNLRPRFEPILWFTKPYRMGGTIASNIQEHGVGAYNESILRQYVHSPDNLLRIPTTSEDTGLHPTQKPLRLMELLIEMTTCEGQLVCDPFCGSGTTLVAALRLRRGFIGYEQDEFYYQTAMQRIRQEQKKLRTELFER